MARQTSLTVALGGNVTGARFLTMSDIFLMITPHAEMMGIQFAPYRFRRDQRGTDFRVAHDPEVRKSRWRRFDRFFSAGPPVVFSNSQKTMMSQQSTGGDDLDQFSQQRFPATARPATC